MKYISGKVNKLVSDEGYLLKSKNDIGNINLEKGIYTKPHLCKYVYLAKDLSENDVKSLYEEIYEKDIDLLSLDWEDTIKKEIEEDETRRKLYEEALRKRNLESSSKEEE